MVDIRNSLTRVRNQQSSLGVLYHLVPLWIHSLAQRSGWFKTLIEMKVSAPLTCYPLVPLVPLRRWAHSGAPGRSSWLVTMILCWELDMPIFLFQRDDHTRFDTWDHGRMGNSMYIIQILCMDNLYVSCRCIYIYVYMYISYILDSS